MKLNWIIFICKTLLVTGCLYLFDSEKVEWDNPNTFSCTEFTFETELISFESSDNKILEIEVESGITGLYVVGVGQVKIKSKNIDEKVTSALIRFNPEDLNKYITISNKNKLVDRLFIESSMVVLNTSFRHSYHANMDALIPAHGMYSLNYFGETSGEVLVSYYKDQLNYYKFTKK